MAAGTIEKIQVILQAVTSGFAKGLGRAQTQLKSVGKNMQNFGAVMQMPMNSFKTMGANAMELTSRGGRLAKSFRTLTHGMRGFRMEALGVMFFGMMMQRMFLGLLQPVMEAFGVFDLFRLMLLTLFLPVMEMIFPFLLSIMEWFMELPDPVKKAIGIFVILGAIFGTIIMVLGQFALGIGSLIQFFPIFGGAIKAVGALLAGLSATALVVIAIIVAVVIAMFVAWKENFLGMKKVVANLWEGIKQTFKGIFDVITGIVKLIVAIFKGDWDGAAEAVKKIFVGLKDFIIGMIKITVNTIAAVVIGIIRIFKFVIDRVVSLFKWLYEKVVGGSIIPVMITAIIGYFWKLPSAIIKVLKIVGNAFIGVGNAIIGVWNTVMGAISNAIVTVLRGVDVVIGVLNKIPGVNIGRYTWKISFGNVPFIPMLARGGIVTKPTVAMIGEQGPEAVVPLGGNNLLGETRITQENNFYGFTLDDLNRELDNRDRRLVDDIKRLVKQ